MNFHSKSVRSFGCLLQLINCFVTGDVIQMYLKLNTNRNQIKRENWKIFNHSCSREIHFAENEKTFLIDLFAITILIVLL